MARIQKSHNPKLIPFKLIKINIPRRLILKSFVKTFLTKKQYAKIGQKYKELEQAENKLKHVKSVVYNCIIKHSNIHTPDL